MFYRSAAHALRVGMLSQTAARRASRNESWNLFEAKRALLFRLNKSVAADILHVEMSVEAQHHKLV
jgi:hypothetical protein